jgi:hypothetical protein
MESGRGLYASTQRRHLNFPPPEGGPQNSPGALALGKPAVPDSPWKGGRFWMKRTPSTPGQNCESLCCVAGFTKSQIDRLAGGPF